MDLSVVSIVKKLFWRVIVYIFSFIVFGILINWGFLMLFWRAIWTFNWPWATFQEMLFAGAIIFTLLIIFPVLYFLMFKWGYFETIVGLVWHEYRDDLVHWMVKHSSHMVIKHYNDVKWDVQALHTKMDSRFDDAPFWSKLLVNYLQKKLPLVDKMGDIIWWLDEKAFANEETLQLSINEQLDPYIQRTDVETEWGVYWIVKIVWVNIAILVGLYFILFYV